MKIRFTENAKNDFEKLQNDPSKTRIFKDVRKTLAFMETNLRHPSLNTHEFRGLNGPNGEKVFTAYVQQKTSCAYRIFWYYGPIKDMVSIIGITPHP